MVITFKSRGIYIQPPKVLLNQPRWPYLYLPSQLTYLPFRVLHYQGALHSVLFSPSSYTSKDELNVKSTNTTVAVAKLVC